MEHIKLFTAPHKALRQIMGEFALRLGRLNTEKKEEVQQLKKLGMEMLLLLTDHSKKEDAFIFEKLEQKASGATHTASWQHEQIHTLQQRITQNIYDLDSTITATQLYRFYLSFIEFQSVYLAHTLEEEQTVQSELQKHFTDAELQEIRNNILKSIQPDTMIMWYKHMFPAQTPAENILLLKALQSLPDRTVFERTLQLAESVLPAGTFKFLKTHI
ncbi:MAG: hypothetical protein WC150_05330 [Bacteroidia bacterium]